MASRSSSGWSARSRLGEREIINPAGNPGGREFTALNLGAYSKFKYSGHLHNVALFKIPASIASR